MNTMTRMLAVGCVSVLGMVLGGCASTNNLEGKVVAGTASIVTVVDSTDARVSGPGIAGAKVVLRSRTTGMSDQIIGTVMTNERGEFTLRVKGGSIDQQLVVEATAPDHTVANGAIYLWPTNKRGLVVLRSMTASNATKPTHPATAAYINGESGE